MAAKWFNSLDTNSRNDGTYYFCCFSQKWFDEKSRKNSTTAAVFQSYFLPNDFDIYFWSKLMEDLNSNCKLNRQPDMRWNISKLLQSTTQQWREKCEDPWKIIQICSRYVILDFSNLIVIFLHLEFFKAPT